jgi:acetoin utilization protein AcuB
MLVRDIMTSNVITIPSNTPVLEAEQIMIFHKFERLPIVDKGKLVGIVTKDNLLKASPSDATTFSRGELYYLLSKLTVKEIMEKNVITVRPDIPVEQAAAIGQKNKVGCLPVVEQDRVIGIVTTNDFFYKIINPLFGIGEAGKRLKVLHACDPDSMIKVLEEVKKSGLELKSVVSFGCDDPEKNGFTVYLNTEDVSSLIKQLNDIGFTVQEREHTS